MKGANQAGGLDDLSCHFGCGAASGASIGRESPLTLGIRYETPSDYLPSL